MRRWCNTNCIDRSQLIKIRRRDAIGVHTADRRETSATGHCGQPACRPPSNYWMSSMLLYVVYKGNTMNTLNWALYDKSTYRFHARRNISHIFYLFRILKKGLINDFRRSNDTLVRSLFSGGTSWVLPFKALRCVSRVTDTMPDRPASTALGASKCTSAKNASFSDAFLRSGLTLTCAEIPTKLKWGPRQCVMDSNWQW